MQYLSSTDSPGWQKIKRLFPSMRFSRRSGKHRQQYRALSESISDLVMRFDRNRRCIFVNGRIEEAVGLPASEFVGKRIDGIPISSDVQVLIAEKLDSVLRSGRPEVFLCDFLSREGMQTRRMKITPETTDRLGEVKTVLLTARDETGLQRAEYAAALCERVLTNTLDALFIFVGICTTDGILVRANRTALKAAGITLQDVAGRPFEDSFWWSWDPAVQSRLREAIRHAAAGHASRYDAIVRLAGDRRIVIDFQIVPLFDEEGQVTHLVPSAIDVTERRKGQELLVQVKRDEETARLAAEAARIQAEEANRTKTSFLANMSHEIRTPIAGILGMAEVLRSRLTSPEHLSFLEMIRESAQSLLSIVGEILDLSKIEAGRMDASPEDFSLRERLERLVESACTEARRKGLRLTLRIDPAVPDSLHGDPDILEQVLRNLVSNAIRYTDRGSVIVAVRESQRVGDRQVLLFTVSDTGIGIPREKRHLLFQSFSRISGPLSRRSAEGTGLGLAISKRLVDLLGGSIWVESKVGQGSAFSFTVPFAPTGGSGSAADSGRSDEHLSGMAPLWILLAEDNRINRAFMEVALTGAGHQVSAVEDGKAAADAAERDRYDLVLMDVQMPRMDGIEATRRIRNLSPEGSGTDPHVPVLALTAFAMPEDRARLLAAGMDGYVSKPVNFGRLAGEMDRVMHLRD